MPLRQPFPLATTADDRPSGDDRTRTDGELLRALLDDPEAALATLYDRYAGLVFGVALAISGSSHDAEDLTQEVFLALCEGGGFDPRRGSLRTYLVVMTRSRAIDRQRARSRHHKLVARWGAPAAAGAGAPRSPLDESSLSECSQRVRQALAQLPSPQRRVLELAYYQDLTQAEIAQRLDTPLGTVKTWAREGLFRLRRSLQALGMVPS